MKKNKILALLLVVAVIVATMGGCAQEPVESSSTGGSSATTSSESSSTGDSSDKVKLEFFYQKNDTPQIMAIVDAFNASQDKIEVELNLVSTDTGKQIFQTRLATDDPMDLLQHWACQVEFRLACSENRIVDLTDEKWTGNLYDNYKELSSVDGKLYSLPLAINTTGMTYNVDMFEENGWKVPTTWDELISLCDTIQASGMTPITFSNKDKDSISQKFYFLSIAAADGTWDPEEFYVGIVDGSGKNVRDNDYTKQIAERLIKINEYAQTDSLGCSYDQSCSDFANGKTPMLFNGTWTQASIDGYNPELNYAWFPLPGPDGVTKLPFSIDCSIAAMSGTGHEEAAKEFIAFAAQPENAQLYIDIDGQPCGVKDVTVKNQRVTTLVEYLNKGDSIKMYGDYFPAGARNDIDNACQNLIMNKDTEAFMDEWQRIMTSD